MSVPTFDEQDEIDASHKFFTSIIGTVDSGVSDNSERIKALRYAHMRHDLAKTLLDKFRDTVTDSCRLYRLSRLVRGVGQEQYESVISEYDSVLKQEQVLYNQILEVMTGGTDEY